MPTPSTSLGVPPLARLVGWLALALVCEAAAVRGVLGPEAESSSFATHLALHAIASLAIGLAGWHFMPARFRTPHWGAVSLVGALAFFVPILGEIGFLIGLVFAYSTKRRFDGRNFAVIDEPEFMVSRPQAQTSYRSTNAREDLYDLTLPEEQRLKALLSVQDMPGRVAGSLLHDLLGDPSDDMRLLAYGVLRSKERDIAQRIVATTERRLAAVDPESKYFAARELAELNWEFIYQNLVAGDMRRHITRQGFNHAIEAIQIRDDDPGLWFLAGRLAISSRQLDSARYCLETALERGFPEVRVLPYLAECAFYQRRIEEVHDLLARMPERERTLGFSAVHEYWT